MFKMKFFKKKEVSQEKTPILFRLERRHTLLDGGIQEAPEDESRRASRANSVGSYTRSETSMKRSATLSKLCLSDDRRSNSSVARTGVITESELSSSWLYKSRKAKIDSDEENISTSSNVPTEDNDMQPIPLRDPALKPVPVKPRQEKISSCCCYFLVAITICIASLGIMAAIGGIIYLEVFAAYKEVSESNHKTQISQLNPAVGRKEEIEGSLQKKVRNFEEYTLSSSEGNFNNENLVIEKVNEEISKVEDIAKISVSDESRREVSNPVVANSKDVFDTGEQSIMKTTLDQDSIDKFEKDVEKYVDKEWATEFDNSNSIDSSFEVNKNIDINQSFSNMHGFEENNVSISSVLLENQDDIDGFSKNTANFDGLDPITNHQNKSGFPEIEQEMVDNSVHVNDEENLNSNKTNNSLNKDAEFENTFEFESQSRNLFGDDNLEQMLLNRPIVEAKPPIEFQKRLVGNQNENHNQPLMDMDRRFSLSEILKHIRTLDVDNKLPSSRQKDVVTEMVRISIQDVGSERKEYLKRLRKKIYD